ncbi:hypothetical protein [Lampropedia puyangensis]|uniref:hypothetical protein n=1 Tax=Lampropedia puyangensis TaxID=1330072 RepID=UPI00130514F4|nr:hypothetical protein [Lampropedia puyangensis]
MHPYLQRRITTIHQPSVLNIVFGLYLKEALHLNQDALERSTTFRNSAMATSLPQNA